MKKLFVALTLAVILAMTFASPAFAGGPPENNPGLEADGPGWHGLVLGAMLGISNNWVPGVGMGMYTIDALVRSGPPVKWQWGQWK